MNQFVLGGKVGPDPKLVLLDSVMHKNNGDQKTGKNIVSNLTDSNYQRINKNDEGLLSLSNNPIEKH